MIIKSWQFRGFMSAEMPPKWLEPECSKRAGSAHLWIHTQEGETGAASGQWVAVNLRGHVSIHNTKPDGWGREVIAGAAFVVLVAAVLIIMLAM